VDFWQTREQPAEAEGLLAEVIAAYRESGSRVGNNQEQHYYHAGALHAVISNRQMGEQIAL